MSMYTASLSNETAPTFDNGANNKASFFFNVLRSDSLSGSGNGSGKAVIDVMA